MGISCKEQSAICTPALEYIRQPLLASTSIPPKVNTESNMTVSNGLCKKNPCIMHFIPETIK